MQVNESAMSIQIQTGSFHWLRTHQFGRSISNSNRESRHNRVTSNATAQTQV
jgi:hypothetical protein